MNCDARAVRSAVVPENRLRRVGRLTLPGQVGSRPGRLPGPVDPPVASCAYGRFPSALPVTGDADADALLATDPLALLIGMLLDQQVPMEWAFRGPLSLKARLGGKLDAGAIAAMPVDDLVAVFSAKPALHRFPGSMAKRTHALCAHIVERYDGDAANIWAGAGTGDELLARLSGLPGFGEEKAKIFLAILGKRLRGAARGLGGGRGPVLGLDAPLGGRHRLARDPGPGPRVEAGPEGAGQDQSRLKPRLIGPMTEPD